MQTIPHSSPVPGTPLSDATYLGEIPPMDLPSKRAPNYTWIVKFAT